MKAILTRVALAALLSTLMISCRPNENAEKGNQNSAAQGSATATPTVMAGSGNVGASENANAAQQVGPGADAEAARAELSTATRELLGVMLRGERDEAAARLADDFKNTRPDGTVEDKSQFLANLRPMKDFEGFLYDEFKVVSLEGDTASVSGLVQAWNKEKKSFYGRFMETFVRRQGKWLLQSARNTELKPEK